MTMDVDPPLKSQQQETMNTVSVHPLAIVNMSDQYTRISCGGSPLPCDAPVVGLLFGRSCSNNASLQIVDADDIPTDSSDAAIRQVSLHHAVFPQNQVVGWYRVGEDAEPTEHDLRLTQELQQHYCSTTSAGDGEPSATTDSERSFVFSLLQVQRQKGSAGDKSMTDADEMKQHGDGAADDDEEEQLPLNLYQLHTVNGTVVLVGVEHWTLETSDPERIAVERVVREQPQHDLKHAGHHAAAEEAGAASSKKDDDNNNQQQQQQQRSAYCNYMSSVQQSLQAMSERVQLLIVYLERTGRGEIPPNPRLMRHVQSLLLQLGPLARAAPPRDEDAMLLSHLSAVAKTAQAVHGYTEKFRTMQENRPVASSAREGRRGGPVGGFRDI